MLSCSKDFIYLFGCLARGSSPLHLASKTRARPFCIATDHNPRWRAGTLKCRQNKKYNFLYINEPCTGPLELTAR